ncbi:MAG: hypothetical protein U9N02_08275 [Campylobacterota bacterium]|nr:hypothetical protein [Campylobacterota bacterium]
MKELVPYLVIIVIISAIVALFLSLGEKQNMIVIKEGNLKKLPLQIELGKYQDSDCGMVIEDMNYASQIISPSGRTYFFHDHGGFVNWINDKSFKDKAIIWVMTIDTKEWIKASEAFYSINETTPMGYGFGAYKNDKDALIDYDTMRLRVLRGETLNNPKIRKQLLGE